MWFYIATNTYAIIYIYILKLWVHGTKLRVYWGQFAWKCCLACEFLAGKLAFSLHKSSNKDFLNWDHHRRQDGKSTITAFEITRDCNDAGDGNHLEDAPSHRDPGEKHTERKSWCQEPCLCSNQMEMFAQHRQQRSWPWHGAVANGVCHLKLKTPILFTKDSKAKGVRNWGKCAKLKQLFDKQWSSGLQRLQSSHGEAQEVHKIHLQGYSMLGVDLPPTPKTK